MIGISQKWFTSIKWIVWIGVIGYSIWYIYNNQALQHQFVELLNASLNSNNLYATLIILLLTAINWHFEALKWHTLINPMSPHSIQEAWKSVLSGLSLGFITPRGIGEYAGRLLALEGSDKWNLIGAVAFGRVAQLFITLLGSIIGGFIFLYHDFWDQKEQHGLIFTWLSLFVCILFFFAFRKKIIDKLSSYPKLEKIIETVRIIKKYDNTIIFKVLQLSLARYVVFVSQFILLLYIFGARAPIHQLFAGISLVYLIKSTIVSLNAVTDLGVRELSSVYFLGKCSLSASTIIMASLGIWTANLLLPAIVGSIFVLGIRNPWKQR